MSDKKHLAPEELRCRFYSREYPEIDSLVMAQILQVTDLGASCSLLEYNDIEGFIASSDFSRKRIRSIKKLIRVGKKEVLQVLRVDEEKGYVDLSKKLLTTKDIEVCTDLYEQARQVHGVLRRLAELTVTPLPEIMKQFGFALHKPLRTQEGEEGDVEAKKITAYQVLKKSIKDPNLLKEYGATDEQVKVMLEIIKKRLASNPVKVEAEINMTCFGVDGIDAVKEGLRAAQALATEEMPLVVTVKASPVYTFSIVHMEKDEAVEFVNRAIEVAKTAITAFPQGSLEVKAPAKVVVS